MKVTSWNTAATSGALGYMEYSEVKKYDSVYALQQEVNHLQSVSVENTLAAGSVFFLGPEPEKLPDAQVIEFRRNVSIVLSRLKALGDLGMALRGEYDKLLAY